MGTEWLEFLCILLCWGPALFLHTLPHVTSAAAWPNDKEPGRTLGSPTSQPPTLLDLLSIQTLERSPKDLRVLKKKKINKWIGGKAITDIQEMLISWLISPECITFAQLLKWTRSNNKENLDAVKNKEQDN